jgi:hypothetical protein
MEISKIHGAFIVSIFKLLNRTNPIDDSAGKLKGFAVEIRAKVI